MLSAPGHPGERAGPHHTPWLTDDPSKAGRASKAGAGQGYSWTGAGLASSGGIGSGGLSWHQEGARGLRKNIEGL